MDGPLSILASWKNFLPEGAVIMAKRGPVSARTPTSDQVLKSVEARKHVKILFHAPDLDEPGSRELFTKIITALELHPDEFAVTHEAGPSITSPIRVELTATASDESGTWKSSTLGAESPHTESLITYSLTSMIASAGLKKSVWAHLKEAVVRARRN